MKKLLLIALTFLFTFGLTACIDDDPYVVDCEQFPTHESCIDDIDPLECDEGYTEIDGVCVEDEVVVDNYLDIYYLNDFHGALEETSDQIGISYIANLVNTKKAENPDKVLFLAGGDMLQGSALSNYYNGLSTITMLNEMGLDSFTIGNHEFDWGFDIIQNYMDGNTENGEANFPFLGANIYQKGTTNLPDYVDPYTIIQKGDHKVGIIGTMGYGLEYSIATSKISDYEFVDPLPLIEEYAEYLRVDENCDVVIVVAHDSGNINDDVAALTGNKRVDAIFNGHSHNSYTYLENNVPVMQSGSNGEMVGYMRLTFQEGTLPTSTSYQLTKYMDTLLFTEDSTVSALMTNYKTETDPIFNEEIIISADDYSTYELTSWISEVIRVSTNADIAFHNYGGTRTDIEENETITLGLLYQIWPFDNVIKTVQLTGSEISALIASNSLGYSSSYETFDPDTLYLVATNDYVFDKESNPFINGTNPVNTGLLLRDLALEEMELQADTYATFSTANLILTTVPIPSSSPIKYIRKED